MIISDLVTPEFQREIVDVPEIQKDGQILITEWNAEQAMKFNNLMWELNQNPEDKKNFSLFMACMVAMSMIKENGELLVNPDHFRELPKIFHPKAFERLYDKAAAMNGFTPQVIEKAKKD